MRFLHLKNRLQIALFTLLVGVLLSTPSTASGAALSAEQQRAFRQGIEYFNTEESQSCAATISMKLPATAPETYRTLFEQAGAKYKVNPALIAAMFVTEHGNTWPDPKGPWASSTLSNGKPGANGPFQFMPGTWLAYGEGGNVQNLEDSTYAAARLIKALGGTLTNPIGTLEKPYTRNPNTAMYIGAAYNAGSGAAEQKTSPTSDITGDGKLAPETVNYAKNIYHLFTTGFVHGNPGYGNKDGTVIDKTGGAAAQTGSVNSAASCSAFASGSVIDTAVNMAWPDEGHGKNKEDAKDVYQSTLPQVHTQLVNDIWSDCGAFVTTVIRSTKADPDYLLRGTSAQLAYARQHPEKFEVYDDVNDTSRFVAGDIIIYDKGHTVIFIGEGKIDKFNAVDASWHDHVPQAQKAYIETGGTHIVRLKGGGQ